jgi:hypothetical protein
VDLVLHQLHYVLYQYVDDSLSQNHHLYHSTYLTYFLITKIYDKYVTLGPVLEKGKVGAHGVSFGVSEQYEKYRTKRDIFVVNFSVVAFYNCKVRHCTSRYRFNFIMILSKKFQHHTA